MRVKLKYGEIPFTLIGAVAITSVIFSVTGINRAKQVKEFLQLLKEKKALIHTIKTILQVFPEGVLIRSLDETTKKVLLEFANDEIKKFTNLG